MKRTLIKLFLLLSLVVNVAHDSLIAVADQDIKEHISEYVLEQTQNSNCGNVGEHHSLFHFAAIIPSVVPVINNIEKNKPTPIVLSVYSPILTETPIKPPIA